MITDYDEMQMQRFTINFDNGLLSMAKSLKDLEVYVQKIKWNTKKHYLNEFNKKNISYNRDDIIKSLGRKHKIIGKNLLRLIELVEWRFKNYLINPISTHNEDLVREFKSVKGVSRILEKACEINLLYCTKQSYDIKTGESKQYYLNQEMVDVLKEIFGDKKEHRNHNVRTKSVEDKPFVELTDKQKSRIKIDSNIGLNITGITDEQIIEVLNNKYPMYVDGKKLADELNKDLPDEQKIKWNWSIERYKNKDKEYLSKIGFRASSTLCTYKAHENENPDYKGKWRGDYLDEFFGKGNWTNYDVNGSIWRLTYNLNHDEFLSLDTDVYNELWKQINVDGFRNNEERDYFKYIAMRLYFGKHSGRDYLFTFNKLLSDIGEEQFGGDNLRYAINEQFEESKYLIIEWLNGTYLNEIFLHESYIYLEMYNQLKKLFNNQIIQVYDSFYFNKSKLNKSLLNQMYFNSINHYKSKYKLFIYHIRDIFTDKTKSDKKIVKKESKKKTNPLSRLDVIRNQIKDELDKGVRQYLISFESANRLSADIGINYKWKRENQVRGFTITNDSCKYYKQISNVVGKIKKLIEEQEYKLLVS